MSENQSVYNIDTKSVKTNELNPIYLWHCRLGHANVKRVSRLHKDGVLGSFDLESYDTCEPCLLRKMATSPFTKTSERASDLLGLIHSDVCGPLSQPLESSSMSSLSFIDLWSQASCPLFLFHRPLESSSMSSLSFS